jgi:hypothetical protein
MTCIYYNSIGMLVVKINFKSVNDSFFENIKIFHSSEDGKLTIKLKSLNIKDEIVIAFSNSMCVYIKETQILIDKNKKEIKFRYMTTKNLLNKDNLYDKFHNFLISDCFDDKFEWKDVTSVLCNNCGNNLIFDFNLKKEIKLIFNFNYDYFSNLELLSCHESHIDNIIPNLDKKLLKM